MNTKTPGIIIVSATCALWSVHASPTGKISAQADRTQVIAKAQSYSNLPTQPIDTIINPFTARPDPNKIKDSKDESAPTDTDKIGLAIAETLVPSGVLQKSDEIYLRFPGSNALKAGDAHTVTIGKSQYIIQIIRISPNEFDFTFQGQKFSRSTKSK